jgi:hypothetical protein
MQMIDTKNITSGAQLIANYAEIRNRLYNRKPAPQTPEKPKTLKIDPERRGKRPLWCLMPLKFDEHCKVYWAHVARRQAHMASLSSMGQRKEDPILPKPMWALIPTYFNDHVVKYLRHKLIIEGEEAPEALKQMKPVPMIVVEVLQHFKGLTLEHMKGATRNKAIILPRHLAMWEIKQQRPDMSFPAIGRWFGGRDHTTAMSACRKIDRMKEDGSLSWYFEAKERMLLTCDYC